jgi:TRAP-type C4-dicarboxylate transport system substrate-binding protein
MELFKYHTLFGEGAGGAVPLGFVVNLKKWNSLSSDVQKVIVDALDWSNEGALKYDVDLVENAIAQIKKDKHDIKVLSPSEIQAWIDWAKPSNDKLLEEIESKGWPAKKIFEGFQKMIKENS